MPQKIWNDKLRLYVYHFEEGELEQYGLTLIPIEEGEPIVPDDFDDGYRPAPET